MDIKNVTVAGIGVLGSQIAFQTAFKGYQVAAYDVNEEGVEKAKDRMRTWQKRYVEDAYGTQQEVEEAYDRITFYTDLGKAVKNADLLIEAVPESLEIKEKFYKKLSELADEKTIFASNSSFMLPSQIVGFIDRPKKYLHLHFANEIWRLNIAEIMRHEGTSEEVFNTIIAFAKSIGMVPIPIKKEQPGYILNTLLGPHLTLAINLVVDGIASPKMVDKTWMISTGAPLGPFAFLDIIGPNTPYNAFKEAGASGDEQAKKAAKWIKSEYLDKGKMGTENNKGVYDYPNPEYKNPDFIKP